MAWHDSFRTRKKIGDVLEQRFPNEVRCSCGGEFRFIGDTYPGCPDFTCDYCGLLVDVKHSPQAAQTGNLAISSRPWDGYPDDLFIVTDTGKGWIGQAKSHISTLNRRPLQSTHQKRATTFVLIPLSSFIPLPALGFKNK